MDLEKRKCGCGNNNESVSEYQLGSELTCHDSNVGVKVLSYALGELCHLDGNNKGHVVHICTFCGRDQKLLRVGLSA